MELDACPVAARGVELVDDDQMPYVVLFAGVLHAGAGAITDRAAEYRAIFAGVPPLARYDAGRRFRELVG